MVVVGAVAGCGQVYAQGIDGEDIPITIEIAQVSETLGSDVSGLLPTSSFYFLKEWKRGFVKFFKFDALAKMEYELDIADEKALELKVVEAKAPNDVEALTKAIDNYMDAKELLEARYTSFVKVVNDANRQKAEEILDKWDAKFDAHRALFDDLIARHSDIPEVQEVSAKLDWVTPLVKFRGHLGDLKEALRRIQDTDEFRDQVKENEDIKDDIKAGVEARGGFRTNCAAIEADLATLKQKLVTGGIAGPEFARQFGILNNELKECQKK